MKNYILILFVLFTSCTRNSSSNKEAAKDTLKTNPVIIKQPAFNLDSVKRKILTDNLKSTNSDTITYEFSLEGDYSAEGNVGKAFYLNNSIKKLEMIFYRETGKSVYTYVFNENKVKVKQKIYDYNVPLFEVKDSSNIKLVQTIKYEQDYNGKLIGKDVPDADLAIYFDLKETVPFTLK
ncbi:hypothetical protein GM921_04805 [Pedobacter sp. LMG 31464]|uniref:Lipoprotein n=1 Tax=Pedobacter planticolens TaxID=2679964 RepID=A0A923DXC2_9SPHI|nr:hypothetical protein [Pedobacter planticolens]MBB2144791.1 hypothetical protein [Pedobacter planticolens]